MIHGIICGTGFVLAALTVSVNAQETPFAKPSISYLEKFSKPGSRIFVYERYNRTGKLVARNIETLQKPVEVIDPIIRKINGINYRLRGLSACPNPVVTYQTEQWACDKAAVNSQSMIYQRASVTLCKTLQLQSRENVADPVSCFSLVGDGSSNDPHNVNYDDDDVVFLGFARIARDKNGQTLRPDLAKSEALGADK